jgi:mannose/fructose-specific phosphotransferase system component IIA
MLLDGVVAILAGVGLPLLIAWLLAKELLVR